MHFNFSGSLPLLCMISIALAGLVPTAPGPGEVFNAGTPCEIKWDVDMTGSWKNVTVGLSSVRLQPPLWILTLPLDLMSGSNSNMLFVANVAGALDGTDATLSPYSWTCPEVNPYSAIYFYQVSVAHSPPSAA